MLLSGRHLVLLTLSLWPLVAWGQVLSGQEERPPFAVEPSPEVGIPFFYEHFSRQHYRQHHQNWAVTQDARGVVYVGNYNGILEYDGATWNFIATPTDIVRSLAVDTSGVVYVGIVGELGYLDPDSTGTLQYVSLLDKIAQEHRTFTSVWATHVTSAGVYFQSPERLFRWDGQAMKVWVSGLQFHTSFVVRDQLYVREHDVGLLQLVEDEFRLVPGGERFAAVRIYMMAPSGEDQILIATAEEGLFLYDGRSIKPFPTDVDGYLSEYPLYHGTALRNGLYALGTLGGGTILIDDQGRFVRLLNEPAGVLDDFVNQLYPDNRGGLWMALDNHGVVRVDVPSALSRYDRTRKLDGNIIDIKRYNGQLYVATTKGLYVLEEQPLADSLAYQRAVFKQLRNESSWSLLPTDSLLFVGTDHGLFAVRRGNLEKIDLVQDEKGPWPVYAMLESGQRDGAIFLGRKNGLARLEHGATGWQLVPGTPSFRDEVRALARGEAGALWVATGDDRILRFSQAAAPVDTFTRQDGLPEGDLQLVTMDGALFALSVHGFFRYQPDPANPGAPAFYHDTSIESVDTAAGDSLLAFTEDEVGNYWLVYQDRVEIARVQEDGSYQHEVPPVLRFPKENLVQIYVEEGSIAWIGNGGELIRYDPFLPKGYHTPFRALVRQITSIETGRVLFGGTHPADGSGESTPTFQAVHNDLHFEFAAPSFNDNAENQYQYYLEGHDDAWSPWTHRFSELYTDLRGGAYRFRVRARNAQGVVSEEAAYGFILLPPWYRTSWAYGLYAMIVLIIGVLAWRYRSVVEENKRAQEQARELARERVVNERLQQANKRLQEANESLKKVNKLKDEFLATTSHELRTPLTAILGFASVLQEELPRRYKEFLDPIESNGQRLLDTVNALLELAKLRAGMMEVRREVIDVSDVVKEVNRLLAPLAYQKELRLAYSGPPQPIYVFLDRRFLERILNNLVGNAIKFTEEGSVHVRAEHESDRVRIQVADTGIGIDETFIPFLFDEFKQESSGLSRSHEGSGLGLSITYRLVELMEGTIEVESQKDRGSIFTVSFPLHRSPVAEPATPRRHPEMVR